MAHFWQADDGVVEQLRDEIGKEVFRVFDAVNLYENIAPVSTMKPVVANPKLSFDQLFGDLEKVDDAEAIAQVIDQLVAKLQRKRRHLSETQSEAIEQIAGMPVAEMAQHLREQSPPAAAQWLRDHRELAQMLDRRDGGRAPILISHHPDQLMSIEQGYGAASRPEDYLESFEAFLRDNMNTLPALLVVTQRPRDLTRAELKSLRLALDTAGFGEVALRSAWRETTNEDIAASIIGFIRQAALGDPLVPYGDRVDRAMKQIRASQAWTPIQRRWLDRIGKQLKQEYIVDRGAFDEGAFKEQGGFKRINKIFDGRLEAILSDIKENLWQKAN